MSPVKTRIPFVFFGTDDFAVLALEELTRQGLSPKHIVTTPDRPQGRQLRLLPPPVKVWAMAENLDYSQPELLNQSFRAHLEAQAAEVFVVASYGRLIPESVLSIPPHRSLNIHPSLLPDLRGPAPLENTILYRDTAGVTVMEMDKQMDHGPIVAQEEVALDNWPPKRAVLEAVLARAGAALLARVLPAWLTGEQPSRPQDHSRATYTKKITKKMAQLDLRDQPEWNYRKFQAFHQWPRVWTYAQKGDRQIRLVITDADLRDGRFIIKKVIPEGKKEMPLADLFHGGYTLPGYQEADN